MSRRQASSLERLGALGAPVRGLVEGTIELSDGRTTATLEAPGDGPPILCLPGLLTGREAFIRMLAEFLARGRRVIAVDIPGYGQGPALGPGDVLAQSKRFVAEVVDVTRPRTMICWSWMARVAVEHAADPGAQPVDIFLVSTPEPGRISHEALHAGSIALTQCVAGMLEAMPYATGGVAWAFRQAARWAGFATSPEDWWLEALSMPLEDPSRAGEAVLATGRIVEALQTPLPTLAHPESIKVALIGNDDRITLTPQPARPGLPPRFSDPVLRGIEVRVAPQAAGHALPLERPKWVTQTVLAMGG